MPTYSYRCDACGHHFEAVQRFTDDPIRECPSCGGAVRRLIHPVGVVFKGSGWYITDSRKTGSESTPDPVKSSTKADAAGESKPETKSETKSDAGAAPKAGSSSSTKSESSSAAKA